MFIDSVFWIARLYPKDKWHTKATELAPIIAKLPNIYITEGIMVETVNFLLRKVSSTLAQDTLDKFLESKKIIIVESNDSTRNEFLNIMRQYEKLSFTDSSIVYFMKKMKIANVISFDGGFDSVKEINRIHDKTQFPM